MRHPTRLIRLLVVVLGGVFVGLPAVPAMAEEFEQEPIRYSKSEPHNRVSELLARLKTGEKRLTYEPGFGYLRWLLKQLDVSPSSQTLVFSKTSLQRQRISPATPRAIYFSDDVYVGFCREGDVLEVSAVDPQLGAVFYTLSQDSVAPKLMRQADNCLICHASSQTRDVPGYLVRSVFSDVSGFPILSSGSYRIDHTSPLEHRWGGWYVTGTHGRQSHLGNLIVHERQEPSEIRNTSGENVANLRDRFDTSAYLAPHSDIVALMVLEHQVEAHNLITRANFLVREAVFQQRALNRELGEPPDKVWESTKSRIKSACEPLVEYLLMSGEAQLSGRIRGTTSFAAEFTTRGPRDRFGRSLREFDLEHRLFKYPCSYAIYSPAIAALPAEAKDYVSRRLWDVLSGKDQSKPFAHLSADDRRNIREILIATLSDVPLHWQSKA